MAANLLKVERDKYQGQIDSLNMWLTRLDATVTAYETKERELDSFMDGSDDNYESMKANIEQNVQTVRKARQMCADSIKMLQDTLAEFDQVGENIRSTVTSAGELAGNTLRGAFEAMNTLM